MAEAPVPILEMKNVGKTYSQNGRSIEALRGANLRVKKGEFVCLISMSATISASARNQGAAPRLKSAKRRIVSSNSSACRTLPTSIRTSSPAA